MWILGCSEAATLELSVLKTLGDRGAQAAM